MKALTLIDLYTFLKQVVELATNICRGYGHGC